MTDRNSLWLFGYGSLIWRPAIPFAERRPARAGGYERRFYQGSTDHRGVPEAPGRVVTLVPSASASCHGVAYRVAPPDVGAVLDTLDVREKGGYTRLELRIDVIGDESRTVTALTYVAAPDNPNWLGPASLAAIARQIAGSRGPSGTGREYLVRLAAALRELAVDDPHVFDLEREVDALALT
ncbi:gamma-glutamylcyclotransferase [Nannocystis radixulma]|uniref:glutathione-specific gamma-glutamylcyclotransferase n=1 Tax=Nannocystis radixulma TaxID=2995305 RepID=A0ABT5B3M9_9BACT|nr:gamma-glutamylcyclotransferase [Nannocystis radixulma]MDC0668686.1 gamma-glutamylcyclotransferase [Nannocystis radixulma]